MNRHIAAYRFTLRLYPSRFRQAYGPEMTQLFADLLADQRGFGQRFNVWRLWAHTLLDTVSSATRERMEEPMKNHAALTRTLFVTIPLAAFVGLALVGKLAALAFLAVWVVVLVARRGSLRGALLEPRRGRWWIWPSIGLVIVGSGFALAPLPVPGDVRWALIFGGLFAGTAVTLASLVRTVALLALRPRMPSVP